MAAELNPTPLITLDDVRAALALPDFDAEAARAPMIPGTRTPDARPSPRSRQAGVLVLLHPGANEALHLVLTRRTDHLRGHSGQVSFPGGRRDPADPSLVHTAQRETYEELGVADPAMQILGSLNPLYIPPSDFEVFPVVAALDYAPVFTPNPDEVAEVFSVPLTALLDDAYKRVERWPLQIGPVRVPYYAFNGHKVWGATAMMLSEFEGRLRAVWPSGVFR
jgi:8-oxo-dGTP pyrophosphatase MutT (NUDIX family)